MPWRKTNDDTIPSMTKEQTNNSQGSQMSLGLGTLLAVGVLSGSPEHLLLRLLWFDRLPSFPAARICQSSMPQDNMSETVYNVMREDQLKSSSHSSSHSLSNHLLLNPPNDNNFLASSHSRPIPWKAG